MLSPSLSPLELELVEQLAKCSPQTAILTFSLIDSRDTRCLRSTGCPIITTIRRPEEEISRCASSLSGRLQQIWIKIQFAIRRSVCQSSVDWVSLVLSPLSALNSLNTKPTQPITAPNRFCCSSRHATLAESYFIHSLIRLEQMQSPPMSVLSYRVSGDSFSNGTSKVNSSSSNLKLSEPTNLAQPVEQIQPDDVSNIQPGILT